MTEYRASPTLLKLHKDFAFVRGIMGCFGSGKSVGCFFDLFIKSQLQAPGKDGFRRTKWAIVRNTNQQLKDTALRTFLDWFPDGEYGTYRVSDQIFQFEYEDVRAEYLFRPLDTPDDVKRLLSMDLTGAFVNEAREVPWAVIDALTGRVGRYPPEKDGGCTWRGILMDTNPPPTRHWWYTKFEKQAKEDPQMAELYHLYKQPPGAIKVDGRWVDNPNAENIENLPKEYYSRMCVGKDPEWIKIYVEGKYGIESDGRPVYAGYNDSLHCQEFEVDPNLPVYVGWDYSYRGQACVLAQLSPAGQLRIFKEFVGEDTGIGLHDFVLNAVKPGLTEFGQLEFASSTGDPAGVSHGDVDAKAALSMLNDVYEDMQCRLPFMTEPADTNSPGPRQEGVKHFLNRLIDGGPALLLHPRCVVLREGFQGQYEYGRVQIVNEDRYKEQPKKNLWSHPHDALQYLCRGILCDYVAPQAPKNPRQASSYYSG